VAASKTSSGMTSRRSTKFGKATWRTAARRTASHCAAAKRHKRERMQSIPLRLKLMAPRILTSVTGCARYATTVGRRAAASCAVTEPDTASAARQREKAA
jgi:hypothetical protein